MSKEPTEQREPSREDPAHQLELRAKLGPHLATLRHRHLRTLGLFLAVMMNVLGFVSGLSLLDAGETPFTIWPFRHPSTSTEPAGPATPSTLAPHPPHWTPATPNPSPSSNPRAVEPGFSSAIPAQEEFVNEITDGRSRLYVGTASAQLSSHAEVNKQFPLDLTICGSQTVQCSIREIPAPGIAAGEQPENAGAALPARSGANTPLGEVMIGGRIRAEITSFQREIKISKASSDEQTITSPTDIAKWRWHVTAIKSGDYTIRIAVTTLKADTDVALSPTKYFDIAIRAQNTTANRIEDLGKGLWTWLGGAAGLAALITALVALLVYRHNKKGIQPSASPTAVSGTSVPAQPPAEAPTPGPAMVTPPPRPSIPSTMAPSVASPGRRPAPPTAPLV